MATQEQETKVKGPAKQSIGFLRASEKAHVAVGDIPLTFMSDLGIMPEQMEDAKKLNRKFVGGMYERLNSMSEAPGKFFTSMGAKMRSLGTPKKTTATAVVKPKPQAKKSTPKAAAKAAAATKVKAAPKPKAAAKAKPKAKPKAKAVATPKEAAKAASAKVASAKAEAKSKADPAAQAIGAMKTPRLTDGVH